MIDLVHFNPVSNLGLRYRGSTWGIISLELSMLWKVNSESVRKSDANLTLAVL